MSDKRATYTIGAIVAAFALVFGMVAGSTSLTTISVSSQDPMQMSGHVIITLADPDGYIKAYRQTDNVVTHDGKDCSADILFGALTGLCPTTTGVFDFIGIGTGLGVFGIDETNTGLGSEILTRTGVLDFETGASGTGPAEKDIVGIFTLDTESTVDEVGLFDAAVEGNMFSRLAISPVVSGGPLDVITITYELRVG